MSALPEPLARVARLDVRNPLTRLPAAEKMRALPPEARAAMAALLREASADARRLADHSWRKHKAPMAAYWKAAAVYFRHAALLLRDNKEAP